MTEKIIVRREHGNLILFFASGYRESIPYYATVGYTTEYGYTHGECSYEYYLKTKQIEYTPEVKEFVDKYARYIRTLPDMQDYQYKLVKRLSK